MRKIIQYEIIDGHLFGEKGPGGTIPPLPVKINEYLKKGFCLYGQPFEVCGPRIAQALVKYEQTNENMKEDYIEKNLLNETDKKYSSNDIENFLKQEVNKYK